MRERFGLIRVRIGINTGARRLGEEDDVGQAVLKESVSQQPGRACHGTDALGTSQVLVPKSGGIALKE